MSQRSLLQLFNCHCSWKAATRQSVNEYGSVPKNVICNEDIVLWWQLVPVQDKQFCIFSGPWANFPNSLKTAETISLQTLLQNLDFYLSRMCLLHLTFSPLVLLLSDTKRNHRAPAHLQYLSGNNIKKYLLNKNYF